MLNFDEAAIYLETIDTGYGKCFTSNPCMEEEPYRHSEKFTLMFYIEVDGFRYLNFNDRAGTGVTDVLSFLG